MTAARECPQHDALVERVTRIDERTQIIHDIVKKLDERQQTIVRSVAQYSGIGVAVAAACAVILKLMGVDIGEVAP